MTVITIVIAITLVSTIWDTIWTGEMTNTTGTLAGVNGSTFSLVKLVPMIFIGAVVIGGAVFAFSKFH
jgi:hypothetical protein